MKTERNSAGSTPVGAARRLRAPVNRPALSNSRHHFPHFSGTIPNQLARRIKSHSSSSSEETCAAGSKMYITFTYPWTERGPWHILKAGHTLNPMLLITGAFAPGLAKR
jgi:hypothetical protein